MKRHMETAKEAQRESGTRKDVTGMSHVDGRHPSMRHSHHEMGEYKDGTDHHEHHRGKS